MLLENTGSTDTTRSFSNTPTQSLNLRNLYDGFGKLTTGLRIILFSKTVLILAPYAAHNNRTPIWHSDLADGTQTVLILAPDSVNPVVINNSQTSRVFAPDVWI
jgi:hypothetical protein